MTENRRYYYLKLKEYFFNSETMMILESMQDGLLYSNLLLKMYLMSLKSGGILLLGDHFPHTPQTIATCTRHQIGTVERGLKIFLQLGLIEILTDGAYYMTDIQLLIGQSSTEGERKKRERSRLQRQKLLPSGGMDICPPNRRVDKCPPILEKEKDIELEIDREIEGGEIAPAVLGRYQNVFLSAGELSELQNDFPAVWQEYIERLSEYMASTGKQYRSHTATIRRWIADDRRKAAPPARDRDYTVKEGGHRMTEIREDEYLDPTDGLIHCRKCGGPRQAVIPDPFKGGSFKPRCVCSCQQEVERRRREAEERRQRMERIRRRKAQGLQDRYLYGYTFANDNGENPVIAKAHAYVDHWPQAFKRNIGLLLFGDVGTGKSFAAGCIANALLDQDVPVLMTNFPTILARLCGTFGEDRKDFLDSLGDYDLLIMDDLGAERNTEYALEQMFSIIDSRYRCNKPLIVTTNLKLDELKHPPDLAHARIYDRIVERCAPILFAGKNFREDNAASTKAAARSIVSYDHSKN